MKKLNKRLLKKIIKTCGTPANFCFEYIEDISVESDIRRMEEYVRCERQVKMLGEDEQPMGVSQWREIGKKYGYWDYFSDMAYIEGWNDHKKGVNKKE